MARISISRTRAARRPPHDSAPSARSSSRSRYNASSRYRFMAHGKVSSINAAITTMPPASCSPGHREPAHGADTIAASTSADDPVPSQPRLAEVSAAPAPARRVETLEVGALGAGDLGGQVALDRTPTGRARLQEDQPLSAPVADDPGHGPHAARRSLDQAGMMCAERPQKPPCFSRSPWWRRTRWNWRRHRFFAPRAAPFAGPHRFPAADASVSRARHGPRRPV